MVTDIVDGEFCPADILWASQGDSKMNKGDFHSQGRGMTV